MVSDVLNCVRIISAIGAHVNAHGKNALCVQRLEPIGLLPSLVYVFGSGCHKVQEQMRELLIHKANAAYLLGLEERKQQTLERQREEK